MAFVSLKINNKNQTIDVATRTSLLWLAGNVAGLMGDAAEKNPTIRPAKIPIQPYRGHMLKLAEATRKMSQPLSFKP